MTELTLNFDTMDEDTELAKEYLQHNASKFRTTYQGYVRGPVTDFENYSLPFKNLAQKLKENAELFSQLEFHFRKIPKHEVVQNDISLLVQNFLFWSSNTNFYSASECPLRVGAKSPLATLGLAAPILQTKQCLQIYCDTTTEAVCYLFCQLCNEAGFHSDLFYLGFVPNCPGYMIKWEDKSDVYGAGVITQRSDLDSAVHAFLGSTTKYPWTIRRIFVQESIYQQFKDVMAWKCNIRSSNVTLEPRIKALCSEVFGYDQKMFLIDFAGNHNELSDKLYLPVVVEAYRTTKELLSMIQQHRPWAASVWSSDVAEANEIAFGVTSPLVWINDCDTFTGPPRASQVFYSYFRQGSRFSNIPKEALELRKTWCKKSFADRVEAFRTVLVEFEPGSKFSEKLLFLFDTLQKRVSLDDADKFVGVENGRICVGTEEPWGYVTLNYYCTVETLVGVFISIIRGNVVFYLRESHDQATLYKLLQELEKNKLPLFGECPNMPQIGYFYKTKVVWTNYGTTFAN